MRWAVFSGFAALALLAAMLFVAALIVALLIRIANALHRPVSEDAADERSRCGRCGYPTRGLSSFFCPECGSDRREVGTYLSYNADGRLPRRLALAAGLLTLVLLGVLLVYWAVR